MLIYFCQRGPFAGYWRRVPLQNARLSVGTLITGMMARGHMVRFIPQ